MTDLAARLRKLIDGARAADEKAAAGDSTLYSLMMKHINFLEGVAFERSRMRPLLEALVNYIEQMKNENIGHNKNLRAAGEQGDCRCPLCDGLDALETVCKGMKG